MLAQQWTAPTDDTNPRRKLSLDSMIPGLMQVQVVLPSQGVHQPAISTVCLMTQILPKDSTCLILIVHHRS